MPLEISIMEEELRFELNYNPNELRAYKCLIADNYLQTSKLQTVQSSDCSFQLRIGSVFIYDPLAAALAIGDSAIVPWSDDILMSRLLQWTSFSQSEITPFLVGLLQQKDIRKSEEKKASIRKERLMSSLKVLDNHLKKSKFLISGSISLADISVTIDLIPMFRHDLSLNLSRLSSFTSWFESVTNSNNFRQSLIVEQFKSDIPPTPQLLKKETECLKILCLHGYRQNAVVFRDKLGAFRKIAGKSIVFHFISADHTVEPLQDSDNPNTDQRGWWFSTEENYFKATFASDVDKGFSESLKLIQKTFEDHGPFHGVLGFSQGASMTGLLCAMKEKSPDFPISFTFALLFAGFKSQCSKHDRWYSVIDKIKTPTLHVYGSGDKVIGNMSEDLVNYFQDPEVHKHQGGHYIPGSSNEKPIYRDFLIRMKKLCL